MKPPKNKWVFVPGSTNVYYFNVDFIIRNPYDKLTKQFYSPNND